MANLHHAYIYYGSLSQLEALTHEARGRFGFERNPSTSLGAGNPDVLIQTYEKFGIAEARALTSLSALKSVSGRALFVLGVSQINSEAQQALLKLFEEPQEGAIYILLAPHGAIIPTLRSRLMQYPGKLKENAEHIERHFLSASLKARSEEIAKLLKEEEGVRERVREFLDALEGTLYTQLKTSKGRKDIREALEDVAKVRSYANDRAPSFKMLLEHMALSLPIMK